MLSLETGPYVCQTCLTGQGWIWPTSTDGNSDHLWVERCDNCDRFKDDFDAAKYLEKRFIREGFGLNSGSALIESIHRYQPYIDKVVSR